MRTDPIARLTRRLAWHQGMYDPEREPRNASRWLKPLQSWQAQRLQRSFAGFLGDPVRRPAAQFFLTDLYGEHDFSQRDADIARVIPMMQKLLPAALLKTVASGTPAAAAGLRTGDAVVAIDGKRVDSSLSLVAAIRERQVGDTVTVTVIRDGQRQDISMALAARPGA